MSFDPNNDSDYLGALRRYQEAQPDYKLLAAHLEHKMGQIASRLGIYPIIMARAKSLESFSEKIQRPKKNYRSDPLLELTDLCGVRVITHFLDQVDLFTAEVKEDFIVDRVRSEDARERLSFREFGYLSRHFIIQLKGVPRIAEADKEALARLPTLKAELQLRTLAQHLWADVFHEAGYKNEFQLPGRWQREFGLQAASLESVDKGLQEIKEAMGTYESSYGAYMDQDQMARLVRRLELLLQVDRENASAAHRLIRAHLALANWPAVEQVYARHRDLLQDYAPALRDVGVAYCQKHNAVTPGFDDGVVLLRQAVDRNGRDIDALCSLAGARRKQGDRAEALALYRKAHQLDPTNPYPLGNYVAEEVLERRDLRVIDYFHALIQGAVERCKKQAEVRVNLPWALFDLGTFELYLRNPHAGLGCYARGLDHATETWMIDSAARPIRDFLAAGIRLEGLDWLDKLLSLARRPGRPGRRAGAPERFPEPVLILAGGCGGLEAHYAPQLEQLRNELAGFRGTIVSGGTRSGIAEMAGDLQEAAGARGLRTIGYAPSLENTEAQRLLDTRYTHNYHTCGKDFSPLEPLTFWEDFLAAGGDPKQVRLIGFNGGRIAGCEFRIAAALGANVAIIRESGRAADALLSDPLWKGHPSIQVLRLFEGDVAKFLEI